ncbi:sucrose nonfermenting 4-like protein isoform X2 [Prunus yedoensis var. nudiflora]|uniref:Sucrose nonfermenting 4-like protein isoform X2 n=1 Tax=Prunus yedoensis var. nudiflora TaxID=2094558 RepID=A0A315ANH6_PRUYE|nr:sucrose nonfermenting 4-like protein isoform X2 [Prunus yedoensis var. nudiflora]
MDSARDVGGAPSTVLIPMRFVWPYGGRSVFLSGSFARWSELIPMTPVEGCPTVFQAIYSVMPGYHQYKFFVDGEWQHDEHQPYVSGEYGLVNTVLLATDPNFFHPNVTPEITSGSNMEEDTEAFRRLVRITDGNLTDVVPRITEGDLQGSRHRISVFLSAHTTYELLPESGKVVALDVDLPVKQAFHILHEQGIPLAPLWDFSKGQFVGVLTALDFILILRELGNHGSNLTEEELETHTIAAWKEGKAYLNGQIDGHGRALPRRFIHAGPYDNLKDVVLKLLQNEVATVPIIHSSSEDGTFPQLLHLASLSGILKCICRYFRHSSSSLPILQAPICELHVGTWVPEIGESNCRPLAMLRPSASLSAALNLLVQAQVSSIPIVDDNDSLVEIYCRSDITALAKDRAYAHIDLNEMTIHQVRGNVVILLGKGVRRLVIVEAGSKRVEGIVSLSDIFKFLLGSNGLDNINPHLVERAVQNAKRTVFASGASNSGITIRHVDSFGDSDFEEPLQQEENVENSEPKKLKKKNKKKKKSEKKKRQKIMEDSGCAVVKKPKKKLGL